MRAFLAVPFAAAVGAAVLAAASPAPRSLAAASPTVAPSFRVAFKAATLQPTVGVRWSYEVRLTDLKGKPLAGRLTVTLVDPIGRVYPVEYDANTRPIRNARFRGVFRDRILFPADARGYTLTLRFAVTVGSIRKVKTVLATPR